MQPDGRILPLNWGCKRISTRTSHVVPHRSTTRARGSLTSQIGRDVVLSAWYGRFRQDNTSVLFSSPTQAKNHIPDKNNNNNNNNFKKIKFKKKSVGRNCYQQKCT